MNQETTPETTPVAEPTAIEPPTVIEITPDDPVWQLLQPPETETPAPYGWDKV